MEHTSRARIALSVLAVALTGFANALEPGQLPPKRLYSIGDSLTRAANANLPGDNLSASWVNGYQGFWQEIFGLPNVNSHNQQIDAAFGRAGRRNWIAAQNGARVHDMAAQARYVPLLAPSYVTVFLGGNDVCRDDPAELPTDAEFESHVRTGLGAVMSGLPQGATALVVAIPDVKALYDVGVMKTALGITSCPTLWRITGSCEAMLGENRTEADREYLRMRNVGYNRILELLAGEASASNPGKFVRYSAAGFELPFSEEHVSDLDCFHLSWRGQRQLAESTWPFS